MRQKNGQNLYSSVSGFKGRLMFFSIVLAGFIAQLAIIGPSTQPTEIARNDNEDSPTITAPEISGENNKKLKPLKVVPTTLSQNSYNSSPQQADGSTPPLQATPNKSARPVNKNVSPNTSQKNNSQQPQKTQRCLVANLICF